MFYLEIKLKLDETEKDVSPQMSHMKRRDWNKFKKVELQRDACCRGEGKSKMGKARSVRYFYVARS